MKKFNFSKGLIVGLLTFALCIVAFAAVGAKADEQAAAAPTKTATVVATYDAANDAVISTENQTAYVYVVKAASGNKIKSGQTAAGQMAAGKISISDLGIKGTNKDVFLYVCNKEVEVADGETVSANLTIKGNANKVVGVIDYTQADNLTSLSVISAYYVDKATKKNVNIAAADTLWSSDGEKFYAVNSEGQTANRKDSKNQTLPDGFIGQDLAGMLETGGTIYIKQAGTSGASGTAQFGSKVAKVKIAKQAKAPKVKIDVAKDTIGLKNGFDFALVRKNGTTNEYTDIVKWYTILPALKTATISTEGDSIVGGTHGEKATAYKPLGKKDANAGKEVKNDGDTNYYYSYTKYAFKALSIDKLFEIVDVTPAVAGIQLPDDYKIAVRKSATEKKPASAYTVIDLALKTEAPVVFTQDKVNDQFLVASADEFSKKGLTLGEIAPFAGYTGTGNDKELATEGFWNTFAVSAASGSIKDRDEGSTFEYAVVSTADYYATGDAAIDWTTVKWKKFDPAKLKITEKLSGKYSTVKGTKKTADLKGTASSEIKQTGETEIKENYYGNQAIKADAIKAGTKSLLLVRRQGDKSTGKRASKEVVLYVVKDGKKYNLYSTVSVGDPAKKYTVAFGKYNAEAKVPGFYLDEKINSITGWTQSKYTGVKLDALTDAEYWTVTGVVTADGDSKGKMTIGTAYTKEATDAAAVTSGENTCDALKAGDYKILVDGVDVTVNIAIREYANIKVKAVYGIMNNTTFNAEEGKSQLVAEIKKGKVCTANNTNGTVTWTDPIASAEVVKYVGDEAEISFALDLAIPSGYAEKTTSGYPKVEAGTGYTVPESGSYTPKDGSTKAKVKIVANTAEAIEVALDVTVVKTYTVTYDLNASKFGVTPGTGIVAPDAATTNSDGKITLADGDSLTGKVGDDNYKVTGWYEDVDCTAGKVVDSNKVYSANTTIYAKWEKVAG